MNSSNDDTHSIDWTQTIGQGHTCPNCGVPVSQKYCSQCGQKQLKGRLAWNELLTDLFSKLINHEHGLFFSLWNMVTRPGKLIRDYVSGKQRPYVNPLTFYFVGAATQLLTLWINLNLIRDRIISQLTAEFAKQFAKQPKALEALTKQLDGDPVEVFADAYLSAIQQGYTYVALLMFCLPWSAFLYWGHRLNADRYRFAEIAVYSLYTFGQILILTGLMGLITVRVGVQWHGMMAIGCYVLFPLWAHRGFFPHRFRSYAVTLLATLASTVIFVVGIIGVFIISILFRLFMN